MSTTTTTQPVTITDSAIEQLRRIREQEKVASDHGLRIGVKGGGCSGFSYVLGFDIQKDQDDVYDIGGIKVFMQKAHLIYLMGMEIDWLEGLNNRGFVFNNPNAEDTCGCGSSFSA
ncbi:MAG: iron-sulfur cluster assembly accessory protein [Lewinella sp.]|nr:iron-sulfur cluster assembly accessory protein [Lewinella sp.]